MKKAITIIGGLLLSAGLFQSCTVNDEVVEQHVFTAEVFEVTASFTSSNNYSQKFTFSQPSYDGDMVLMYILWEVDNTGADVWRLVPQTEYFNNGGFVEYSYDFTRYDFRLMLDFNFSSIPGNIYQDYFLDQIFRAVVIPGNVTYSTSSANNQSPQVDFSDYEATMKHFGLSERHVKKLK